MASGPTSGDDSRPPALPQTEAPERAPERALEAQQPDPVPPPQPQGRRGGGFLGVVLGGVLAAGMGAGVALWFFPQGWAPPRAEPRSDPTRTLLALGARVSALELRAQGAAPDMNALETRLAALESGAAAAATPPDLAPLAERLAALEAAAGAAQDRLSDEVARQLAAAMAGVEAQLAARAAEIEATTGAARARAEQRALVAELLLAADSGDPAAAALERLAAMTPLPPELAPMAPGLETLGTLQGAFPEAARAALAAAPLPPDSGALDRALGFLRAQTGARSLAPREGGDTDAILSRAEAAVRQGDLAAALVELDGLPPEPAAALAEWRARAAQRQAALTALTALQARSGEE